MDSMSVGSRLDVIVVGAGISGIHAAKFYLDLHPRCELRILDRDTCVGGRSYDSFWTQWTVGSAEFPDMPMEMPPDGDTYYGFFKAKHTTKYLEQYVNQQNWAGKSLRERIMLATDVLSIFRSGDGWELLCQEKGQDVTFEMCTSKIIIASGMTSNPNVPSFAANSDHDFTGPIIHQEHFGSSHILSTPNIQSIAVLGAGKSSADMVYSAVKADKTVSWILKDTETTGPGFFLSPRGKGPYKNAFEVGMTRMAATFTPSLYNPSNWWTRLLHSSKYGTKLLGAFWSSVDSEASANADYEGRTCLQGFHLLRPHSSIFWQNATGELLNQADFFETIAHGVRIYSSDVSSLSKGYIKLQSGEVVNADAILCGTGWKSSPQFFTEDLNKKLGLPYGLDKQTRENQELWERLESKADQEVIARFPKLSDPPSHYHAPAATTPCRLYRHIVPLPMSDNSPQDRSIVFVGYLDVGDYFLAGLSQAMWATAYMDGKITLPEAAKQREEVAMFRAWSRRRYLSRGEIWNNMTFDLLGYVDSLLEDLGLRSHI